MHGNTALALLLGAQRRFEVTGEAHFLGLATRFFALVDDNRSFATGGTTLNELWGPPGAQSFEFGRLYTLLPSLN